METITRNLDDLIAFHRVAMDQSFTRAAEALGGSKSLISNQVRRLETYLGVQLFHRSTRSVRLTEAGKTLLAYSTRLVEISDEAGRRLRDLQSSDSGFIRLTSPVSLGDAFYPSFIQEIRKKLPGVTFDTDLSNDPIDFRKEEIDFAIRATGTQDPDLVARYLGKLKDVVCCSPSLAKKLKLSHPSELSGVDCVLTSTELSWNTWTLISKNSSKKEEVRVQVAGKLMTNQYNTAQRYARDGHGVTRLPHYEIVDDLKSGKLVQLFSDFQITTHSLYLVYPKTPYTSRRHQMVRDGILAWFKERRDIFFSE